MNKNIKALMDQTNLHRNDHTVEQRNAEVMAFAKLLLNDALQVQKQCPPIIFPEYHVRKHYGVL